ISINGLEVLCLMVDRMGEDFKPHISSVMVAVVDRLGDSKDQVRDQAQQLLLKLMMPGSSPQFVFERLMGAFNHKLWHVREGVLICLQNTLNLNFMDIEIHVSPKMSFMMLNKKSVKKYENLGHVGEKVRQDLAKKGIPAPKLTQIYQRFDEVKASGNMLATADFVDYVMSSNFDQGLHHLDVPNKDVEEELWSSPLMHYTSPFDDYKELFDDIENDQVFKFPDVSNGPMEDLKLKDDDLDVVLGETIQEFPLCGENMHENFGINDYLKCLGIITRN
ncbi:CLIP-associating protein 1/2, partial [Mytilus galloprovincialis]